MDTLIGGKGNDTYVVDSTVDVITEAVDEGVDTVQSYVNLTLGNNLENLTLAGGRVFNATGNALNNTLTGNALSNTLIGGLGDDILVGDFGNDTLTGSAGADRFSFNIRNQGVNTLTDLWLLMIVSRSQLLVSVVD